MLRLHRGHAKGDTPMSARGIGASVLRKEDDRFLRGRGMYVRDVKLNGMWDLAFLRSPVAHARIKSIAAPAGAEGRVFSAGDLTGLRAIRADSTLPNYKVSDFPVLASGKVRYVGEPVAVAAAPTRAAAEDIVQGIAFDYEELNAVVETWDALEAGSPLLFEEWGDNVVHTAQNGGGDMEAAKRDATHVVKREYRISRQIMVPMEHRGCVAHYDSRLDELTVYMASQCPHIMVVGLARAMGLEQRKVRVISPDVGGGFGLKTYLEAESVAAAWLTMKLGRPVRWLQDNSEHLIGDANCREHRYRISAYADDRGKILGIDFQVVVDGGAYGAWPPTAAVEAAQAAGILSATYDLPAFHAQLHTVATNKPHIMVYRGVARPGVCFAGELTIDAVARAVGREAWQVRMENMVRPEQMPYRTVTKKYYDSGDYPESVRRAVALIKFDDIRARQAKPEPDGRYVGVGFASYTEQTAHGTSVLASWGLELIPGYEPAEVRLTPDGALIVAVGTHSHGQGQETIFAQVANEMLGIDPDRISVRLGDTATSPYGTGTYASRSTVMASGAIAKACKVLSTRIAKIGAHLLQADVSEVKVENGEVVGPSGSVGFDAVGRAWYLHPEELPPDIDQGGLTITEGYRPEPDSGVFSYATHAAAVAVDPETGLVELLDYVVVEDCGTAINPLLVEGQVIGGTAQGIGTALYEEAVFDKNGQPSHGTLADYILPGATEIPDIKIEHLVNPSPWSTFGEKGLGEGSAIAPAAAITNAVNDALGSLGVEILESPVSPRRVRAAIEAAAG